jgi:DNA-binding MarR family transcriptional regulator
MAPTPPNPIPDIEAELALLLRRAEASRRADAQTAHRMLDRAAYVILRHLAEQGPTNLGSLATALGVDASTATRQVSALQRDGLVRRDPDPHDRRGTVVAATDEGLTRYQAVRQARAELYATILSGWSATDLQTLARLLHRLNAALDAHARR